MIESKNKLKREFFQVVFGFCICSRIFKSDKMVRSSSKLGRDPRLSTFAADRWKRRPGARASKKKTNGDAGNERLVLFQALLRAITRTNRNRAILYYFFCKPTIEISLSTQRKMRVLEQVYRDPCNVCVRLL